VYAVGDDARVLRYRDGLCETLPTGIAWPDGAPTFWGVVARCPDDVRIVGGTVHLDGPHGVVMRYDGARFALVADLPPRPTAPTSTRSRSPAPARPRWGAGTVVLRHDGGAWRHVAMDARAGDHRLFTMSSSATRDDCYAVGGEGGGFVLRGASSLSGAQADLGEPPGLNGGWVQDDEHVFVVGVGGYTAMLGGARTYRRAGRRRRRCTALAASPAWPARSAASSISAARRASPSTGRSSRPPATCARAAAVSEP